jgi:hypothetical protein
MKKIIVTAIFCLGVSCSLMAQQTTTTTTTTTTSSNNAKGMRFYYYPSSNVYFDPTNNDYWYYDDATSQWTSATELPGTIHLVKTGRVTVYHNDADVWKDNAEHLKKYKTKKNGQIKAKGDKKG